MVGVVLAGGAGTRIGGHKAGRTLAGRPLASYPAEALAEVCERVAIVAKPGTELPPLPGVERWDDEPAEPRHPRTGIAHALHRAGDAVLVCAADMPFVTADVLRAVAASGRDAVPAVLALELDRVRDRRLAVHRRRHRHRGRLAAHNDAHDLDARVAQPAGGLRECGRAVRAAGGLSRARRVEPVADAAPVAPGERGLELAHRRDHVLGRAAHRRRVLPAAQDRDDDRGGGDGHDGERRQRDGPSAAPKAF